MIYSMTGFARTQQQNEYGVLVCEMRSINHRYLEVSVYLPDMLRVLEMLIRERLREHIKRGKIECNVRFQAVGSDNAALVLNETLVQELCCASEKVARHFQQQPTISVTDILRFPGVIQTKELDSAILQTSILQLLDVTAKDLIAARLREGEELQKLFLQRMDLLQQELAKVRARLPQILHDQRERILKRLQDIAKELDPTRLEQEMLLFAQRIDVSEEIERAETHIAEVRRCLNQGGMVGRRLDFLLQELNREANTLGSKSVDPITTHAAVEMKVLIEQVREQVQNVE